MEQKQPYNYGCVDRPRTAPRKYPNVFLIGEKLKHASVKRKTQLNMDDDNNNDIMFCAEDCDERARIICVDEVNNTHHNKWNIYNCNNSETKRNDDENHDASDIGIKQLLHYCNVSSLMTKRSNACYWNNITEETCILTEYNEEDEAILTTYTSICIDDNEENNSDSTSNTTIRGYTPPLQTDEYNDPMNTSSNIDNCNNNNDDEVNESYHSIDISFLKY